MLWYLQAYLSDMTTRPNSKSYRICKRVFHKTQEILFEEGMDKPKKGQQRKVYERVEPAMVALGAILGAVAAPTLLYPSANWAISQGVRERHYMEEIDPEEMQLDEEELALANSSVFVNTALKRISSAIPTNSPTLEELHRGKAFSFGRFVEKTSSATANTEHDYEASVVPRKLASSHYFHSEIQFLLALVDISSRLVDVPKPARQALVILC